MSAKKNGTVNLFDKCCGCSACENICSKKAVSLSENGLGYRAPIVDFSLCVNCGLCVAGCPVQGLAVRENYYEKPLSYAVLSKSEEARKGSSSGGVFATLAEKILDGNGVVFGASYDKNNEVRHICVDNKGTLECLKGSKYVQSRVDGVFSRVKTELENGRKVMFTGTPCQVAGLKSFLGRLSNSENLLLCDIVCHGTPNPKYYRKHISELEKRFNSRLRSVNFRAKKLRGQQQDIEYVFENGKHYNEYCDIDPFRSLFTYGYLLCPGCFECKFASTQRVGDITLGDFWGIEKHNIEFASPKGTSLVLISTEKGKLFFDGISDKVYFKQTRLENSLQPNLKNPTAKPRDYEEFLAYYKNNSMKSCAKKFAPSKLSRLVRLKRKLSKFLRKR